MIDVLSHGRLEAGFVRGVPYEILPANSNPVRMNERHWEALDLIVKAWTTMTARSATRAASSTIARSTSGRARYQQPHPPIWISTTSPGGAAARRRARLRPGDVPHRLRRHARDLRRLSTRLARGRPRQRRADRSAGLCGAGLCRRRTRREARAGAEKLLWYITVQQGAAALRQSAGLRAGGGEHRDAARRAERRSARTARSKATVEGAIEAGIMFAGTPDQVLQQIKKH